MGHGYQITPQDKPRPWEIHPIWRGFGCLMILVIPLMSYAAASILIDLNTEQEWGFPVPVEMARTVDIDIPLYFADLPNIQFSVPHLYANLILGTVIMFIGYGILMFLYALMYNFMGPPRMGPLDAEPVRRRPKRRKKDWRDETYRR